MTSSRSKASISSWATIWLVAGVLLAWSAIGPAIAEAGRKRVVVLDLEGPKAKRFHADIVKLLKKTQTVVPTEKWNSTANKAGATGDDDDDIKKVAKKLKVDAIVQGKIEKRRDEYLIQLRVRDGKTGAIVGSRIDTKSAAPKLDTTATSDLRDELVGLISDVSKAPVASADDEDADAKPAAKKKGARKADDDDDEDKTAAKTAKKTGDDDDADDKPGAKKKKKKTKKGGKKVADQDDDDSGEAPKKFASRSDDETAGDKVGKKADAKKRKKAIGGDDAGDDTSADKTEVADKPAKSGDEEDSPIPKKTVAAKPAKSDDDDSGGEVTATALPADKALTAAERAVDVIGGLSVTRRSLGFNYSADLADKPAGYNGVPVAGLLIDATVYPLAWGHTRTGIVKNLGLHVMLDKVLSVSSKTMGMTLSSSEIRYAFGAVFRYPLGHAADPPVIGLALDYGHQSFVVGGMSDLPDTDYTILDPSLFFRYPISPKFLAGISLGYMMISGAGKIAATDQYGTGAVSGIEGELGLDYMITAKLFARAAVRFETIGFTFDGTGTKTTMRDADPGQDVFGARDTYLGGFATVGYLY